MLRIRMASGRELLALSEDELSVPDDEDCSAVRRLKQRVTALTGQPRFRQRLLRDGWELRGDEALELPLCLELVLLGFADASA